MGFEDKAFDNSSSNTTDDLQGETHNRFLPPNVVYLFNIQDNPRPQNDIDILEQNIREKSPYLLKLLLQDISHYYCLVKILLLVYRFI